MKFNVIGSFVLSLIFTAQVFGQDSTKTQTLFGHSKLKTIGIYGSSEIQYGQEAGSFTALYGSTVMLQFNKKWGIGVSAFETGHNFAPTALNALKLLNFDAKFGGLNLEYTPKPLSLIHVSFPLFLGAGFAEIDSVSTQNERGKYSRDRNKSGFGDEMYSNKSESAFFVVQPGIKLETNVTKFAKLYLGANYRLATGKSTSTNTNTAFIPVNTQLNGLSISLGAKIGIFDFDTQKQRRGIHFAKRKSKEN
jgi:hypothetical protein